MTLVEDLAREPGRPERLVRRRGNSEVCGWGEARIEFKITQAERTSVIFILTVWKPACLKMSFGYTFPYSVTVTLFL